MPASHDPAFESIKGHIDSVEGNRVRGWAFDPARPTERVAIGFYLAEQCLFTLRADRFRNDLREIGFGDGQHAFDTIVPAELFVAPFLTLDIRFVEAGRELNGSPVQLETSRIALTGSALMVLGHSIASLAAAADNPAELETLRAWLLAHHDLVYTRQGVLARATMHRELWFDGTAPRQAAVADILHDAARATVARYDVLRLEPVAEPVATVIIPAFNQFAVTYQCLRSIIEQPPLAPFEVVIVDDGSTDETIYAGLVMSGAVRIVRNPRNLGFLGAINAGVAVARGQYLLLLNNDTEVGPCWLDSLLQSFAHDPAIGIAGSKLVYPDGRLQEAGGIVWRQGTAANYGHGDDPNRPQYCFMRDVDYVSGAALMVERALFDAVGGLSSAFAPAYYEDTDLCFKVREAGRRVVVQPHSVIVHHEGVSAGTDVDGAQMKRFQRLNHRTFVTRWAATLEQHGLSDTDPDQEIERRVTLRLLFVDDTVPTPDQDAGSNAAMQFMMSLQRLGYAVSFVGADNMAKISPYTEALEAAGVRCYYWPYSDSVQSILDETKAPFDVVFIHRLVNMEKYHAPVRKRFPSALIVYCMADVAHLRLEREAEIKQDPVMRRQAQVIGKREIAMVETADRVVVHSSFEAQYIARAVPAADVHVIAWTMAPQPTTVGFALRRNIAFVAGYNHPPNVDAAIWLVETIMPLVWIHDPAMECLLIGSQMPPNVQALARPRVQVVGHLPDLQPTLAGVRLTVAPLRFGAGMKGKVLTSLAAGLPCVATPCAVEGMGLPEALDALVARTPEDLAARIRLAYHDEALNAALGTAGLDYIAKTCASARIDELLRTAIAGRPAAATPIHPVKAKARKRTTAQRVEAEPG